MKAILLDRDGVLVSDPPDKRLDKIEKVKIFPEEIEALKLLDSLDYTVFIITNQAGINEGLLTVEEFQEINNRMYELVEPSGIKFEKLYFSPCRPDEDCESRKPNIGMMKELQSEYDIDVANSWMLGDRDSDIQFGQNSGTRTILIQRTDGLSFRHENSSSPDYIAGDLLDAIKHIEANQ